MYRDHKVNVVVPAFNEELLIKKTLLGMPDFVDRIIVIDDCSTDGTNAIISKVMRDDDRIKLIVHEENLGVGQSLIDGYLASLDTDGDVTAVMAGDNQMDPRDLPNLLDTLIDGSHAYVKGNRLLHADISAMPKYRYLGNSLLTLLTKFATGYYSLMDPQCGYTVMRNTVLADIPIANMTKGYAGNADMLTMLNIRQYSVADCEVRPVYGKEVSTIKLSRYVPLIIWLLSKNFVKRLWWRYVVLDFHPLVLFYAFGAFITTFVAVPLAVRFFYVLSQTDDFPRTTVILFFVALMTAIQSFLFAIWLDMEYGTKRRDFRGVRTSQ